MNIFWSMVQGFSKWIVNLLISLYDIFPPPYNLLNVTFDMFVFYMKKKETKNYEW